MNFLLVCSAKYDTKVLKNGQTRVIMPQNIGHKLYTINKVQQ